MTLNMQMATVGFLGKHDTRANVGGRDAVITTYINHGKWGYVARWCDLVFIQEPAYMTERKAVTDAIAEIESRA